MNPLLKTPSTDFNGVRDGRNSLPLYIDIDLSSARSIAANTQLVIEIAANSFYADADTTNGGNATVHFQDTNLGSSSAPFFVSPGFIANVGFTKLLIENTAQAGKRLRIFYGVDIDFQAGVNSSIAISGSVSVSNAHASPVLVSEDGYSYGVSYKDNALLGVGALQIVAPAANVNGIILFDWATSFANAAYNSQGALLAKNAAPASIIDGDVLAQDYLAIVPGNIYYRGVLNRPVKIPAGKGLYYYCPTAHTIVSQRFANYVILP